MNQGLLYYARRAPRLTVVLGLVLVVGTQAYADVVGRLHIVVKDDDNEKPVAKALVTLHDSAHSRADIQLTTDENGSVVSPQIEARQWRITVKADTYLDKSVDQAVVADTTTDVEVDVVPTKEKTIKVSGNKNLVPVTNTAADNNRSGDFAVKNPVTAANPQNLSSLLRTEPSAALDSYGQLHIRGEHSATSLYLDGWRLPGAFQGRVGQLFEPAAIQNIDFITGGFAPEYGGDTAAVLNLQLKAGSIDPFFDVRGEGGSWNTFDGGFTAGGQFGQKYGVADDQGKQAHRFTYLLDFSARTTDNAVEPPQPDNQTAHNSGYSVTAFGNLQYRVTDRDTVALVLSLNPARTNIANRTGLSSQFASFGQGYGYLGQLTAAQAADGGIGTQEQDGQNIWQRDMNEFFNLSWRRDISSNLSSILSFGMTHSGLDVLNANPAVNFGALPMDNSIEYNPTITRNSHSIQGQGSITYSGRQHTVKAGFSIEQENGIENYQLVPASQLALDGLYALGLTNLTPEGVDLATTDSDGNEMFSATGPSPTLTVKRTGYYDAAYMQDTWKITPKFVANYGLRLDMYQQTETAFGNGQPATTQSEFVDKLSPRVNLSYEVAPRTVLRGSYNKLFIEPPLAQGSILGTQIQPEVLDQYDLSLERQLAPGHKIKLAAYYKEIQNQIDTGLLVPGTQIGVFTSVNFNEGHVRGTELSYEFNPTKPYGLGGFLSWANSLAKPTGFDNTGGAVPVYNDHDQLNTIAAGLNYTFTDTSFFGASVEYGSGFTSSTLTDTGPRSSHTEVDLRYSTKPMMGNTRLTVSVANLFDSRALNNFNSGFSGTRFQQGRTILVGFDSKF